MERPGPPGLADFAREFQAASGVSLDQSLVKGPPFFLKETVVTMDKSHVVMVGPSAMVNMRAAPDYTPIGLGDLVPVSKGDTPCLAAYDSWVGRNYVEGVVSGARALGVPDGKCAVYARLHEAAPVMFFSLDLCTLVAPIIQDFTPKAATAAPFCPSCGSQLQPDDLFCPNCGARRDGSPPQGEQP